MAKWCKTNASPLHQYTSTQICIHKMCAQRKQWMKWTSECWQPTELIKLFTHLVKSYLLVAVFKWSEVIFKLSFLACINDCVALLAAFNTNRYPFVLYAMCMAIPIWICDEKKDKESALLFMFSLAFIVVVVVAGLRCLFIALNTD